MAGPFYSTALAWSACHWTTFNRIFTNLVGRFAGSRTRTHFKPLLAQLDGACGPLSALSAEIEERFLACGRALQDQANLTTQLTEQSRRLREFGLASGRDDAAIRRVGRLIATHLSLSEEFAREVERLACTLDDHADRLQTLRCDQQQLERSFAPMRFLHAFFRIESATLSAELQTLFSAVTAEMQRLYTDVSASFADHAVTLGETRLKVGGMAQKLHAQAAHHTTVAAQKRGDIERSLARLDTDLKKTAQRNERLDSAIGDLNRETDAIAVSLQYQDITRQKMEHVQMAARSVLEQMEAPGPTPFRQRLRVQQALCEVQDVQLGGVQEELGRATATIKSGLRALLERLQWIEGECLSVAGLTQITADMDTLTAEMIATHRLTSGLMRDSLATLTHAIEAARGFSGATSGATDTMRRLATDLHLIGLNAQVQSVRANNGSLEVLSGAASAISREAGALSSDFESRLAAATDALSKLVQRSEAFYEKTRAQHAALQTEDARILDDLNQELATGKALVTEVSSLLHQFKTQTDALLPSVDLADFSRDAIENARAIFSGFATACAAGSDPDQPDEQPMLSEAHSRYTMHSERIAHATVLAGKSLTSSSPVAGPTPVMAAAVAPASTDQRLGDNVELF